MRIRLSEEDATRLGCPRDLEFDFERLMGRELMELERQVGWTFDDMNKRMQGVPATNTLGEPLWQTDIKGNLVLDDKGKPIRVHTLRAEEIMVATWLCVRRANPQVAWDTFDFNLLGAEFPEDEQGKERSSKSTTSSTSRRSRTSSASRRGSSGKG